MIAKYIFLFKLIILSGVAFSQSIDADRSKNQKNYSTYDAKFILCIKGFYEGSSLDFNPLQISDLLSDAFHKRNATVILHKKIAVPDSFKSIGFENEIDCSSNFSHSAEELINKIFPNFPPSRSLDTGWTREGNRMMTLDCTKSLCKDEVMSAIEDERKRLIAWSKNKESQLREIQEAKEKKNKEDQEAAAVTLASGLKVIASADPSDVVAQVLNYSSGCKDTGCDDLFWIKRKESKCQYSQYYSLTGVILKEIDLDQLDPKSIKFVMHEKTDTVPDWSGRYKYIKRTYNTYTVQYEGKDLFSSTERDLDRLKRGWSLIYSKYCKGREKEF